MTTDLSTAPKLETRLNMKTLRTLFQGFLNNGGYCTPPGRAKCALDNARTVLAFQEYEDAGLVKIEAEPEQESYFDVFGEPESGHERKATIAMLERDGCWCVISKYWDGSQWQLADSIGMCAGYSDPTDPLQNCYVPDLMRSAIDSIGQAGEH